MSQRTDPRAALGLLAIVVACVIGVRCLVFALDPPRRYCAARPRSMPAAVGSVRGIGATAFAWIAGSASSRSALSDRHALLVGVPAAR